jgi:hypothetical protein
VQLSIGAINSNTLTISVNANPSSLVGGNSKVSGPVKE